MNPNHFEFGTDLRLPEMEVLPDGRLRAVGQGRVICAPYFELVPTRPEGLGPSQRLSHFVAKPFPGHEWNHFALYVIQHASAEIMRSVAYAALRSHEPPREPQWARAEPGAIEESLSCLERLLRVYQTLLGPRLTRRVVNATREYVSSHSFVVARDPTSSLAGPDAVPPGDSTAAAKDMDETYIHASFAAEAFHAFLDVRVLEAQGISPQARLFDRAADNPLLSRLLGMSSSRAMKFLVNWHRKSYRFPRFTRRFFRSAAKLPIEHVRFAASDGQRS